MHARVVVGVIFLLAALVLATLAQGPVGQVLAGVLSDADVPPCLRNAPLVVSTVRHTPEQRFSVGGQGIYALFPATNVPIFAGPGSEAAVVDPHATVCSLYVVVSGSPDGRRVHVAQVYLAENGESLVALWNRSGWIDANRLKFQR